MRSYPAFRLGGQVFFAAAILSFYAPFGHDSRFFWLLVTLILGASLAAVRLSHWLPRLGLALLPGLAFLVPVSGWLSAAAGAAILLYAVIMLIRGNFCPEFHNYRREAVWILSISGVFAVISFFWTEGGLSSFWLLMCTVLLVLLALRLLRVEGSMGLGWQAGSLGMLLAVLAAGVLVGVIVWFLRPLALELAKLLATGFAYVIVLVTSLVIWVMRVFVYLFGYEQSGEDPGLPELYFPTDGVPESGIKFINEHRLDPIEFDLPWIGILTIVTVALLVLGAIMILRAGGLRRLRRYRTKHALFTAVPLPKAKRKKDRGYTLTNRDQLRLIYSRYLDFLRIKGVEFHASDTTADISQTAADLLLEPDERLRALYRKARYSPEEISEADLNEARTLFDRLVAEENLKNQSESNGAILQKRA